MTSVFEDYEEMVIIKDIPLLHVWHHLLPSMAKLIFVSSERRSRCGPQQTCGSKSCQKAQLQERLTSEVADMVSRVETHVVVVVEAEHLCMSMRNNKPGSAVTSAVKAFSERWLQG